MYADFTKVFDRVNHVELIEILGSYGIYSFLLLWKDYYITNRTHVVVFKDISTLLQCHIRRFPEKSSLFNITNYLKML